METKVKWTTDEWIKFGNRVKAVRTELQDMLMDVQTVCRKTDLRGISNTLDQLERWKSRMQSVAVRDGVPPAVSIFYGPLMEEET